MRYLDQAITLLTGPLGIFAVLGVLVVCFLATQGTRWQARLIGVLFFLSTQARFVSAFDEAGPLLPVLNELREYGRIGCLTLSILLTAIFLSFHARVPRLSTAVKFYLLVQLVATISYALVGNWLGALFQLPFAAFPAILMGLITSDDSEEMGQVLRDVLHTSALLFLSTNLLQYAVNPSPLYLANGLFTGNTGNPQAAAIFLAIIGSGCIGLGFKSESSRQKWLNFSFAGAAILLLMLTGSRTGTLMLGLGILASLIPTSARLMSFATIAVAGLAILYMSGVFDGLIGTSGMAKITSTENSRSEVWAAQVRNFLRSPLFGSPFPANGRHAFGESSWFGAASAMGLAGLLPLIAFAVSILHSGFKFMQLPAHARNLWQPSLILAGFATVLAGSVTEAYLLGVATAPVMWIILLSQACDVAVRTETEQLDEEYDEDEEDEYFDDLDDEFDEDESIHHSYSEERDE